MDKIILRETEIEGILPSYNFMEYIKMNNFPITAENISQWYTYKPIYNTIPPMELNSSFNLSEERNRDIPIKIIIQERPWIVKNQERVKLFVFIKGWEHKVIKYIHPFTENFNAVQEMDNTTEIITPQNPENWWLGFSDNRVIDRIIIGKENAKITAKMNDISKFGKEATEKAKILLEGLCNKLDWNYNDNYVTGKIKRKEVRICRLDIAVHVSDKFRCITSDRRLPKDDQVVQKMLALINPILRKQITTVMDLW